jgi:hypothetical protein
VFSPYKDITVAMDWNTYAMRSAVTGTVRPLVGSGGLLKSDATALDAVTLAFATGPCTAETWAGVTPAALVSANIGPLDAAGVDYIVSTGGAAGTFTCTSGTDLAAFIGRYASPHLVGIDFDIEGGTAAQAKSLVAAAAGAQSRYPGLRFSFTLATLGASDGSYGGLNALGDATVKAIKASTLTGYTINLMTMDYGAPATSVCVVKNGLCDMGASAVQAVKNLQHTYGIPASQIEITPMIARNDVSDEIFTLADVSTVSAYVRSAGLAGVHFWSLDRDVPCATATTSVTTNCSSVPNAPASLAYTNAFLAALG